jgi:hypothetical protein
MTTILALFLFQQVSGQSAGLGAANIINLTYNFTPKWSASFEPQFRSDKFYSDFNFKEYKISVNYNVANRLAVLAGTGIHETYSYGGNYKKPLISKEYRLWEQFSIYNTIGRLKLEHRYRIEQRWLKTGFRNRFRYRLNAIFSLNQPKLNTGALYAYINDEIYLTDKPGYFQRNRFYVGLGYRLIKQLTIQTGYVHQFDYFVNRTSAKNFLQTSFLINVHSHRSIREPHPATSD